MPKKEREIGGKRYIEVSHPGITVRVECTDIKLAESRLKKVLKALV